MVARQRKALLRSSGGALRAAPVQRARPRAIGAVRPLIRKALVASLLEQPSVDTQGARTHWVE